VARGWRGQPEGLGGAGVDAFEATLERLKDAELRDRLGSNAARRSEEFSLETVATQYQSLYQEVA